MAEYSEEKLKTLEQYVRKNLACYVSRPNINSVGIGFKRDKSGKKTNELQIQFTVDKKLKKAEIEHMGSTFIEKRYTLPDGSHVQTKVLARTYAPSTVGFPMSRNFRKDKQDPIMPGISICHEKGTAGTIGGVVYDNLTGTPYLLSNWHVFAEKRHDTGNRILQPGPIDDNSGVVNQVGSLVKSYLGMAGDCAVCSVSNREVDPRILGLDGVIPRKVAKAKLGDKVVKSGRTTAITYGLVTRVALTTSLNYGSDVGYESVGGFEIEPHDDFPAEDNEISSGGDSGALWMLVDEESGKPTDTVVGLHFAGEGRRDPREHALACNIHCVLRKLNVSFKPQTLGRFIPPRSGRQGYDPGFLRSFEIPLPTLLNAPATGALRVNGSTEIPYEHFSVTMHSEKKFAVFTAHNVKGYDIRRVSRVRWRFDERVPVANQVGNEIYRNNDWDRGHLVRRIAVNWGTEEEARRANEDTFHYTNATPQHMNFNQDEWLALEDWVLDISRDYNKRLCVFTGPIFSDDDVPLHGIKIPQSYWKVIFIEKQDGELGVAAFRMNQIDMAATRNGRRDMHLGTYQVSLQSIENDTGLSFEGFSEYQHESHRGTSTIESIEAAQDAHRISFANDILM